MKVTHCNDTVRLGIAHIPCLLVFLALVMLQPARLDASGVLYVSASGNDANDCFTMNTACKTISAALSKSVSGDFILIAAGSYTENVTIHDTDLTVIGFGPTSTVVQGGLRILSAIVRLFDLGVSGGFPNVSSNHSQLTLTRVRLTNGLVGLASSSDSVVEINDSLIGNNCAQTGAGISNGGVLTIRNTLVMSNTACGIGGCCPGTGAEFTQPDFGGLAQGGGLNNSGVVTILNSAFIANSSSGNGGAIDDDGALTAINTTLSGNHAQLQGGAIVSYKQITLTNVTIVSNTTGTGGAVNVSGTTRLHNTLIANNTGGNCTAYAPIASLSHNLDSSNSCGLNAAGDLTNTNPLLGPLADNGGPTPTHALLPGSPAIGAGDKNGCPPTDQRGVPRPQGAAWDIGAYEAIVTYTQRLNLPLIRR